MLTCDCLGTNILLSMGKNGYVEATLCKCISIHSPEFIENENWEDSLDDTNLESFNKQRERLELSIQKQTSFNLAKIPNIYFNALKESFYSAEIIDFRNKMQQEEIKNTLLLFSGTSGSGKTQAAIFLMMAHINSRPEKTAYYMRCVDFLESKRLTSVYNYEAKKERTAAEIAFQSLVKKVRSVDFLILDRLDHENLNSMQANLIFDIIDQRENNHLTTVLIITRYDKTLTTIIGENLFFRLKTSKHFYVAEPDYRNQIQSEDISKVEIETFIVPAKILTHDVDEHQIMTWLTRNPAFETVSTQKRKELTEIIDGRLSDKDRPNASVHKDVWVESDTLIVQGPICDHEDKKLYALLLKELANSHREGNRGLILKISLRSILRLMGLYESGENISHIKRQINRLVRMSLDFSNSNGNRWMGPLLNDVYMIGESRDCHMVIEFNHFMIRFYKLHAFTTFDKTKSKKLKGDSSAFYLFYSSHSLKEMTISIEKCKKLLAIESNSDKKKALLKIRKAVENLIAAGIMNREKTFIKDGKLQTCLA